MLSGFPSEYLFHSLAYAPSCQRFIALDTFFLSASCNGLPTACYIELHFCSSTLSISFPDVCLTELSLVCWVPWTNQGWHQNARKDSWKFIISFLAISGDTTLHLCLISWLLFLFYYNNIHHSKSVFRSTSQRCCQNAKFASRWYEHSLLIVTVQDMMDDFLVLISVQTVF